MAEVSEDNRITRQAIEKAKLRIVAIAVSLSEECGIDRWMALEVIARTAKHICRRDI